MNERPPIRSFHGLTHYHAEASALLLLAAAIVMPLVGGGCTSCDDDTSRRELWKAQQAANKIQASIKGNSTVTSGSLVSHTIDVAVSNIQTGDVVKGEWTPPFGASNPQFNPPPDNPNGPPPYTWSNLTPNAPPAIQVQYTAPMLAASESSQTWCESFKTTVGPWQTVEAMNMTFTKGAASAPAAIVNEPAASTSVRALADPTTSWWQTEYWFYTEDQELTAGDCQNGIALLQSGKVFFAVSFPVVNPDPDAPDSVTWPIALAPGGGPRLALLDHRLPNGQDQILSLAVQPATERVNFASAQLPAPAGYRFMTFAPDTTTQLTLPSGFPLPAGVWEVYTIANLDFGSPVQTCSDCVLEGWACYEGASPPAAFAAGLAARAAGVGARSIQAEGITCAGPIPIRLDPTTANPAIVLGGPGFAHVNPPGRAQFLIEMTNTSASSVTVALTAISDRGLASGVYQGEFEGPDLSHTISSVTVSAHNTGFVWVVADVPAGTAAGLDTIRFAAISTVGGATARMNDILWVGDWVAPPTPTPQTTSQWVPVVSHNPGRYSSLWRTDLGILNTGQTAANVTLKLYTPTGILTSPLAVPAGAQVILSDAVALFPFTGSAALEVVSDQPVKVSSRNYNLVFAEADCYPGHTMGQNYEVHPAGFGLAAGDTAYLTQLTENADYRSNISLTNTGGTVAHATVALFDGAGGPVGSYPVDLNPGEYKQETQPYVNKFGQSDVARGYASVTVSSGSGVVAVASVVDNLTQDPTTLPMVRAGAAQTTCWAPVASHNPGRFNSRWRTDLGILNTGAAAASVTIRFHNTGGTSSNTIPVAAGQQAILTDVIGQIPDSGSAALEIVSDVPVMASSRSYSQVGSDQVCFPDGTLGQNYEAIVPSGGLVAGQSAYLTQLIENSAYRSNIGVVNIGTAVATGTVELFDGAGVKLTDYPFSLNPGEYKQEVQPFMTKAGKTDLAAGYAKVTVLTGSGVFATGSVIDNFTNDPTTMSMIR